MPMLLPRIGVEGGRGDSLPSCLCPPLLHSIPLPNDLISEAFSSEVRDIQLVELFKRMYSIAKHTTYRRLRFVDEVELQACGYDGLI